MKRGEEVAPTMLSELVKMRKSNDEDAKGLTDSEIFDELLTIRGGGFFRFISTSLEYGFPLTPDNRLIS